MIGKWHLGLDYDQTSTSPYSYEHINFTNAITNGPNINGFDQHYLISASLDMPPYAYINNSYVTSPITHYEGVTPLENAYSYYRVGPMSKDFNIQSTMSHFINQTITQLDLYTEHKKQQEQTPAFFM